MIPGEIRSWGGGEEYVPRSRGTRRLVPLRRGIAPRRMIDPFLPRQRGKTSHGHLRHRCEEKGTGLPRQVTDRYVALANNADSPFCGVRIQEKTTGKRFPTAKEHETEDNMLHNVPRGRWLKTELPAPDHR